MAKEIIDTCKNEDNSIFNGQDLMEALHTAGIVVAQQPKYRDEPIYLHFHLGDQVFGIDGIQIERDVLSDGSEVFNFRARLIEGV